MSTLQYGTRNLSTLTKLMLFSLRRSSGDFWRWYLASPYRMATGQAPRVFLPPFGQAAFCPSPTSSSFAVCECCALATVNFWWGFRQFNVRFRWRLKEMKQWKKTKKTITTRIQILKKHSSKWKKSQKENNTNYSIYYIYCLIYSKIINFNLLLRYYSEKLYLLNYNIFELAVVLLPGIVNNLREIAPVKRWYLQLKTNLSSSGLPGEVLHFIMASSFTMLNALARFIHQLIWQPFLEPTSPRVSVMVVRPVFVGKRSGSVG